MSKKSRRRNKKILGALLLGGLGLAAANRNKGPVSTKTTIMDNMPKDDIEFKETVVATPVSTKTTIMDSMPARPKLNQKSKRVTDKGEVYTIEGAKAGVPKKIGNTKTAFVGDKIMVNTSGQACTITLPTTNLVVGDEISFLDRNGTFASNPLTLNAGGSNKIFGATANGTVNTNNAAFTIVYTGAADPGWKLTGK